MEVAEQRRRRPPRSLARALGAVVAWDTWVATGYLLATLPLGVFWFTIAVTGLAVGVATIVVWAGLPILFLSAILWRVGARNQRALLRGALGIDIPEPYRQQPAGSLLTRFRARLTDPTTWRDFSYLVLLLPLGALWLVLVLTAWGVPLALLLTPLWYRLVPAGAGVLHSGSGANLVDTLPKALALAVVGLLLCLGAAHLVRGMVFLHGRIASGLLGPTGQAELAAGVQEQRAKRAKAVDVAATERRRIERDLHDGAQQRLVALAMDLGMAKEKFVGDPQAARSLLEEAHDEAKRALAELRNLARGIHPAVLTDRGLDAAISALAGRSPVPVEVGVDLRDRPPAVTESTAYFVVAEALTNVTKHAAATHAEVHITRQGEQLVVEVRDDGVGGADPADGSGLAGLADRVASVDGRLIVTSPEGGPTVVRAELPCGS
jgi:signal transduction histidine kinase